MLKTRRFLRAISYLTVFCMLTVTLVTFKASAVVIQDNPPLVITELVADSNNYTGGDAYEYVEIYNNSGKSINLADYRLFYRYPDYPNTADLTWDITANSTVPDKAVFIVWLRNSINASLTKSDFVNEYNTSNYHFEINASRIAEVYQAGMANTYDRTIIVAKDDNTIISKASYTAADVTEQGSNSTDVKKSIQYRYNDDDSLSDRQQLIKIGVADANPGTYTTTSTYDQVPKYPQNYSAFVAPLMVTEVCPKTTPVNGWDGYEFVELYNNSGYALNIDDYRVIYTTTVDNVWDISGTGISLPAHKSVVLWVRNGYNPDKTKQDFKNNYGIVMDDQYIVEVSPASLGMSNTGPRSLSTARDSSPTVKISTASYETSDVELNKGIEYRLVPTAKTTVALEKMGPADGSPGIIKATQGLANWYSYSENINVPTHDYSFAVLPDSQYYSTRDSLTTIQNCMTTFLCNSAKYGIKNLKYTFSVGDIVNNYSDTAQWPRADAAFDILDSKNMPYGILAGNHDCSTTADSYANYHNYFGYQRFSGKTGFGGYHLNSSGYTDGMYSLISYGSDNYIIVLASYNPTSSLLTWMKNTLNTYSTRTAIVVTHSYLVTNTPYQCDFDTYSPNTCVWVRSSAGTDIYNDVVSKCSNVRYVICGHAHGAYHRAVTIGSRTVQEIVLDFQFAATPQYIKSSSLYVDPNYGACFGMGFLTMMFVDKTNNLIHFRTYSPYVEKNRWFDKYDGVNDTFDVPLSLVS